MRRLAPIAAAILFAGCAGAPAPTPTPTPTPTPAPSPTATAIPSPLISPSPAPSASLGPIVDAPLSADVVADLQDALDGYVESGLATSISAAVIRPGIGTWYGASGLASRADESAATSDTVYAIGSITKTFVAALILRLAEDDYLDLDDLAVDRLGPVAGAKANGATIRQLLGHRSGVYNYTANPAILEDKAWTVAEVLDLIGEPSFAPGERYEYSNSNYLLLGLIAEVATGGPVGELLHEYLIDRFDLSRTYYGAWESATEPLAHGYVTVDGELIDVYDGSGRLPFASAASAAHAAGSMASTAREVARWIYLLYGGRVLRPQSQAQLLDFSQSIEYGLGTMRFAIPGIGPLIGHSGGIPGFMSAAYMATGTGTIVVLLTNGEKLDMAGALRRLLTAVAATD